MLLKKKKPYKFIIDHIESSSDDSDKEDSDKENCDKNIPMEKIKHKVLFRKIKEIL